MRVLITGHKGYIGSILAPMLGAAGHQAVGVDNDLFAECLNGDALDAVPALTRDVRDLDADDVDGFDAIIHLAGLCNDPLGDLDPALTMAINHDATLRLATLAKHAGVQRFLQASSCSVYGASGDDWVDEDSPFRPVTAYGRSKALAEESLRELADDRFSPVFLRAATVYGASSMLRFDLVLNNLVAWANATGRVHLKSDGAAWRPLVHVADLARAYRAALEAPREAVHAAAFNIGVTDHNHRIRELAEIVRDTVPGSAIEIAPGAPADRRCYRVDCAKFADTFPAFRPDWTPRQGAAEVYRAIRGQALAPEAFEGARYSRLHHIRKLRAEDRLDDALRWRPV